VDSGIRPGRVHLDSTLETGLLPFTIEGLRRAWSIVDAASVDVVFAVGRDECPPLIGRDAGPEFFENPEQLPDAELFGVPG